MEVIKTKEELDLCVAISNFSTGFSVDYLKY